MRDVEMLIRYFGLSRFLHDYRGNLKVFLDQTCQRLNATWDEEENRIREEAERCAEAIRTTQQIFDRDAFKRWNGERFEGRFNRTVFDIMTYYFRTPEVGARALDRAPAVKESFQRLSEGDAEFDDALQATTKTVSATAKRLEAWGDSLEETLELDFPIPRLADGSIRVA
jgi:hypothetical protein